MPHGITWVGPKSLSLEISQWSQNFPGTLVGAGTCGDQRGVPGIMSSLLISNEEREVRRICVMDGEGMSSSDTSTFYLTLHNSVVIPRLGLGTFRSRGEQAKSSVLWALQSHYCLIDTASIYKNEAEIGQALRDSGLERDKVFITSKISPFEHGYDSALLAVGKILERLDCGYLDLCLIHWPGAAKLDVKSEENAVRRTETWQALEDMYKQGKCRAIGVSNYTKHHLEGLLSACTIRPMVNQVELHPYLPQTLLRKYCTENNIVVQAYSPLGCGNLLSDPLVSALAARYNRTPAQILLRWGIQHDVVVLPKSVRKDRIQQNAEIFYFLLSKDDMECLDGLDRNHHFCWSSEEIL
ncbi:hypothetical protein O6H91_23G017900 [Diphasiastrum complanatum]|uniref:Uncharacterized protein n=1 Tax=Diphasiastrum complanatum TaxID=34168 RepID=A0ACC2A8W6_DIPCM|nr:hypothetical protein O6H91_23G017900 [Diphasiastrum complanatum]